MRIDRPDDGDPVPATPDAPELRQAGAGAGKVRPASHDTPPEPAGAATRTERALQSRAKVDAAYRVADAVDQAYARVCEVERNTVTPAMRRIEAADPQRHLAGLEHRVKGRERLAEKVGFDVAKKGRDVDQAVSNVKDTIRYTFVYDEAGYTAGVYSDCDRLQEAGFERFDRRNSWDHDEYKGINTRWRIPGAGQIFEVQFHTHASLDAKEETHFTYERIRSMPEDDAEVAELRAYQREVTAKVPVPPGAVDIPDYRS